MNWWQKGLIGFLGGIILWVGAEIGASTVAAFEKREFEKARLRNHSCRCCE